MADRPGRRRFLQLLGSGGIATAAGCLGETDDEPANGDDDEVEPVIVTGDSNEVDDPTHTITVRYDTKTVSQLPSSYADIAAADGAKLVVMEARMTVMSARNGQLKIREESIGLRASGERHQPKPIQGLPFIKNAVLPPTSYEAWAWFEVPEDVTEATLVAVQPGTWYGVPTTLRFERDDMIKVSL